MKTWQKNKLIFLSLLGLSVATFSANCAAETESHSAAAIESVVNIQDEELKKIWAWADEFKIPEEEVPRNKEKLLAKTNLVITRCDGDSSGCTSPSHKYKSYPKITYLPPEIGRLSNLQELSLFGNLLQSLPPEIGQLRNLQNLYILGNELKSLPPEIGQLQNLQIIYVMGSELQSLPPEIGQLQSLQTLNVSNNQLQSLPVEISQLSHLQGIWVSGNQIKSLPPEIGQLNNLKDLSIAYNQLQSLPATLTQLKNLNWLDIRNNPQLKLTSEQEKFISRIKYVHR